MTKLKKVILPVALSISVLGLSACGNNGETLISSKAGDVTTTNVIKEMGKTEVANTAFQILIGDILKDKYGKKVDADKIKKSVDEEIKKYGGEKQFLQILQQQQPGMTVEQYKDTRVNDEYRKKLLEETVKVKDADVKENAKKASHILIQVKSDSNKDGLSDKAAKAKAEKILAQVKKNKADFAKIAKKESGDTGSKANGGSLGYVVKGQTVEPFEKALFKLKEGELSGLVKTDFGYHIILADKQDDFDSQKNSLKEKVRQTKIQKDPKLMVDAYKKLLKDYDVDYKDKDIKKIVDEQILTAQSPEVSQ
ncbi:peptidylprolyl isomerase [Macrococcoides bohemicum]|uniref:peptidylprolyl isomerase n=1 Tax=Macrococcoides bohemicum TaxID=1903056 RepID=A0A328A7Z2_9STAP|nr:peptidylprolyl isomerase [Macrococcus bohemicus]RAK49944.1 peptidylprolyl isomerase [Macrococcus bohemicus]